MWIWVIRQINQIARPTLLQQQNFLSKNKKKNILIAPSWGKQNLLESTGYRIE